VASGEKARNTTSDRARRNIGGGEPLVLDCTLATLSDCLYSRYLADTELTSKMNQPINQPPRMQGSSCITVTTVLVIQRLLACSGYRSSAFV